ncbi:MAG: RIP metalloprotease RseP [Micropepsaceae bacterium]
MLELVTSLALGGLGFLFVITLVVFVHELGHFMAGRMFGVRIDSFSIGFGREIAGFTDRHGTRWKIGWLPLGGFVKFWGDEGVSSTPDQEKLHKISDADRSRSFHHKPLHQKAIIAVAGPASNFVLAVVILAGLLLVYGDYAQAPIIGNLKQGYPAQLAGLKPGDRVVGIDGSSTNNFSDIVHIVSVSDGRPLNFHIQRGAERLTVVVTPTMITKPDPFGDPMKDPGVGISPVLPGEVEMVVPGSPAAISGLKPNDWILAVNDEPVTIFADIARAVAASNGAKLNLAVSRPAPDAKKQWNREKLVLVLTPATQGSSNADVDKLVLDAAGFAVFAKGSPESFVHVTFGLFDAVSRAVDDTKFIVVKTFYFIGQLLTGRGDYQQLSGPLGIATVSAKVTVQFGVIPLINLAAVLSVSIGLLNLFPIPMLDGGHILYYGIEAVRGRPLGEWAQELGFRIGLALVVSLLLFATWNDLTKLGLF